MRIVVAIITDPLPGWERVFALTIGVATRRVHTFEWGWRLGGKKAARRDTKRGMERIARPPAEPHARPYEAVKHAPVPAGPGLRLLPEDRPGHAPPGGERPIDLERAQRAVRELLEALGVDPAAEGLADTPRRVVDAYCELLVPVPFRPTTFAAEGSDQLVVVSGITFGALCEHHLLPFSGVAHVGYVPGERIIGLSKLARLVTSCAAGLQVQERVTTRIADRLVEILAPRGVGVVVEATHACMSLRGACQPDATTRTSVLRGVLRDESGLRQEFLAQTADRRVRT